MLVSGKLSFGSKGTNTIIANATGGEYNEMGLA
jgi:hypothetical protein